nr:MAG TPA: hypothetical protein [Caudoviricetes sp.]DAR46140.1 MAG TPA: hypothetical protein [Caudoviricetes sp.]
MQPPIIYQLVAKLIITVFLSRYSQIFIRN